MTSARTNFESVNGHGDSPSPRNTRTSRAYSPEVRMWYCSASEPRRLDAFRPLGTLVVSHDCGEQPWVHPDGCGSGPRALMTALSWSLLLLGKTVMRHRMTYYWLYRESRPCKYCRLGRDHLRIDGLVSFPFFTCEEQWDPYSRYPNEVSTRFPSFSVSRCC